MRRLFGTSNKQPPVNLDETAEKLQNRVDTLDTKIRRLDAEIAEVKKQINSSRGPAQQRYKQKAIQLLKQRKMYESQRNMTSNQQFNIEQTVFVTQTAKDNIDQVRAMKESAKQLKQTYKKLNINEIENLHDQMQDLMDDNYEITEILSRNYATPDGIEDDDALLAELDMLDDELAAESSGYLDDVSLDIPSTSVATGTSAAGKAPAKSLEQDIGLM